MGSAGPSPHSQGCNLVVESHFEQDQLNKFAFSFSKCTSIEPRLFSKYAFVTSTRISFTDVGTSLESNFPFAYLLRVLLECDRLDSQLSLLPSIYLLLFS